MSQLANLLALGQAAHAAQLPATFTIAGTSYTGSTSGLVRDQELGESGFVAIRRISFWVPLADFTAGIPTTPVAITVTAPSALAGTYTVQSIAPDGTGTNLLLTCTAPPQ